MGVWSEKGEFGVWREWGELGISAVWGGGNRLDSMGEVLEVPPFKDFASRRAFKDLASSARVAGSITDVAQNKPRKKG